MIILVITCKICFQNLLILHGDKYILKANCTFLVKRVIRIMCVKNSKNTFEFVKLFTED